MARRHAPHPPKPGSSRAALTITRPHATGIDIGSASHCVAVPPDRDDPPVREFPSFTEDLHALADWLKACGVDTVAMESTGVYGIPVCERLEARGLPVLLVNARHVKNVSGRKSDVLDCQWLQQLMTYGLRRGGVSSRRCGVCVTLAVATARDAAEIPGPTGAAQAKGPHAEECSMSQRDLRCRGGDGPEDTARPRRRGTLASCWRR